MRSVESVPPAVVSEAAVSAVGGEFLTGNLNFPRCWLGGVRGGLRGGGDSWGRDSRGGAGCLCKDSRGGGRVVCCRFIGGCWVSWVRAASARRRGAFFVFLKLY